MAKLSARGATKLASASKSWTDDDGWDHKQRIALRSDGKVLRAHDVRDPKKVRDYGYTPSKAWNRGTWSIMADMSAVVAAARVQTFEDFAVRNGYEVD